MRVKFNLRSGERLTIESSVLLGGPDAPMSEATLVEKFRSCLTIGLDAEPATIDNLAERVLHLEREPDVAALVAAFPD